MAKCKPYPPKPCSSKPLLRVLNFSGGRQSTWLINKYLRREWKTPERFAVVTADPGMEKQSTYAVVTEVEQQCAKAGIEFVRAPGPNLYEDLLNVTSGIKSRIDTPPFWTKDDKGKRGKLRHSCTREYKIRPMRRAYRQLLYRRWGIQPGPAGNRALKPNCVASMIGFSAQEASRIKPSDSRWNALEYPAIEAGATEDDIAADYRRWGIEPPKPSLCNGCPFHGLRMRKEQFRNETDRDQAITVDDAIRHGLPGVKYPAFTSDTLVPLRDLEESDFSTGNATQDEMSMCSAGVCFV